MTRHHYPPGRGILIAALLALLPALAAAQTLRISEFMAANNTKLIDQDGDTPDWIEIHNPTAGAVNLLGWSLTDNPDEPQKWTFPSVALAAGGRRVVFASGKNLLNAAQLHTNFKLDADGEYLALAMPNGTIADSYAPKYPEQRDDISYGRVGATEGYYQSSTPGAADSAQYLGLVEDTKFSVGRGYFSAPFQLELTCATPGAEIRYTLDSSVPTLTSSTLYAAPLTIDRTTVVRVTAFLPGWLPAEVKTATYLFPSSVFTQPVLPAGFPATWGGPPASNILMNGDYEVDPEIVNSPVYSSRTLTALISIPSICVAMPVDDWFDRSTGIYSNGAREGIQWRRAASIELIHPDGTPGFGVGAGIQIQGGTSTQSNWKSPKLSIRVRFSDIYGPSKLRHKFFPDSDVEEFDNLILDAGLSTWNHPTDYYTLTHAQFIRDNFINDLQLALGHPSPHNRYAHVYLNGLYWGLYYIHERVDEHFLESYLGANEEDYDVIRHTPSDIIAGSNAGYVAMLGAARAGLANQTAYETFIDQYLDLPSFIDYMLLNFWAGNTDWAHHNWFSGRNRNDGSGFQFFAWDSEHTLKEPNDNVVAKNNVNAPTEIYQLLRANPEFRMAFTDRAYQLFFNDGLLTPARAWTYYEKRAQEIDSAVIMESARWGDHRRDHHPITGAYDLYTRDIHWINELNRLRTVYFPARTGNVVNQLRAAGMYPNTAPPTINLNGVATRGGPAAFGDVVTLTNPNAGGQVYFTLDGSDPRRPATGGNVSQTMLLAESAPKKAFIPTTTNGGGSLGLAWTGLPANEPFNDGGWIAGAGNVGYDLEPTYLGLIGLDVRTAMYNVNTSCLVRIPFTLTNQTISSLTALTLGLRHDDGFVAYINGVEIARNLFSGTPQWNSAASSARSDSLAVVVTNYDISAAISALHTGTNILAIQIMNNTLSSSDLLLGAQINGTTSSVASSTGISPAAIPYTGPLALDTTRRIRTRVLNGSEWSALNEAAFAFATPLQSLRIVRIMYHPPDAPLGHPDAEFVELRNIGNAGVILDGVRFTNGVEFTFPNRLLPSGESVYVVLDTDACIAQYGLPTARIAGEFDNSRLDNAGERLVLVDAGGQTIHDFIFDDDWYPITDGGGKLLELLEPLHPDLTRWGLAESWRAGNAPLAGVTAATDWLLYEN